jgi:hypothetical protein
METGWKRGGWSRGEGCTGGGRRAVSVSRSRSTAVAGRICAGQAKRAGQAGLVFEPRWVSKITSGVQGRRSLSPSFYSPHVPRCSMRPPSSAPALSALAASEPYAALALRSSTTRPPCLSSVYLTFSATHSPAGPLASTAFPSPSLPPCLPFSPVLPPSPSLIALPSVCTCVYYCLQEGLLCPVQPTPRIKRGGNLTYGSSLKYLGSEGQGQGSLQRM